VAAVELGQRVTVLVGDERDELGVAAPLQPPAHAATVAPNRTIGSPVRSRR
jgi:hypothetical protein